MFDDWSMQNALTALVGLGAAILAWDRVSKAITAGPLSRQKQRAIVEELRDANLPARVTALEAAQSNQNETLNEILKSSQDTHRDVQTVRDESTRQHNELKDHVHAEVRRIEENNSAGRGEVFRKIDGVNDRIDRFMERQLEHHE